MLIKNNPIVKKIISICEGDPAIVAAYIFDGLVKSHICVSV